MKTTFENLVELFEIAGIDFRSMDTVLVDHELVRRKQKALTDIVVQIGDQFSELIEVRYEVRLDGELVIVAEKHRDNT